MNEIEGMQHDDESEENFRPIWICVNLDQYVIPYPTKQMWNLRNQHNILTSRYTCFFKNIKTSEIGHTFLTSSTIIKEEWEKFFEIKISGGNLLKTWTYWIVLANKLDQGIADWNNLYTVLKNRSRHGGQVQYRCLFRSLGLNTIVIWIPKFSFGNSLKLVVSVTHNLNK